MDKDFNRSLDYQYEKLNANTLSGFIKKGISYAIVLVKHAVVDVFYKML